jgi:hypothetical protein
MIMDGATTTTVAVRSGYDLMGDGDRPRAAPGQGGTR